MFLLGHGVRREVGGIVVVVGQMPNSLDYYSQKKKKKKKGPDQLSTLSHRGTRTKRSNPGLATFTSFDTEQLPHHN